MKKFVLHKKAVLDGRIEYMYSSIMYFSIIHLVVTYMNKTLIVSGELRVEPKIDDSYDENERPLSDRRMP